MSRWRQMEEILDRYEQQTTDWLAGRLPRRSDGFVCADCGAEFRTEGGVRSHRQRKHGRRKVWPRMREVSELGRGRLSIAWPYRSAVEREQHRQAVYRAARRAGVRVVTRTQGGEVGVLRAALEISARCLERRAVPRLPEPEPRRLREAVRSRERGDLEAVRELARTVRRLMAEMVEAGLRGAS